MALELTKRLFVDAGITVGMRVLDVGCGRGDISLLVASLVGSTGKVVGIDSDEAALEFARNRFVEQKQENVLFSKVDLNDYNPLNIGQFDAIVGRRVLMYLKDPTKTIACLANSLRPGGIIAFQEHDGSLGFGTVKPMPLLEQAYKWVRTTVEREGGTRRMGFELRGVLTRAGLTVEQVRAEALLGYPEAPFNVGAIVKVMLPRIIQQGVATEKEVDVDTLEARLVAECREADAVYLADMAFFVWAKKPF